MQSDNDIKVVAQSDCRKWIHKIIVQSDCTRWLKKVLEKRDYKRWFEKKIHNAPLLFLTQTKKSMDFFTFILQLCLKQFRIRCKKNSVIGLPKFTIVIMTENWHQLASFSKENLFFEDYSFGSPMSDVFSTDSEFFYI